ncbi:hypothetical protein EAMG_05449, partial [Escherichia coli M056]
MYIGTEEQRKRRKNELEKLSKDEQQYSKNSG